MTWKRWLLVASTLTLGCTGEVQVPTEPETPAVESPIETSEGPPGSAPGSPPPVERPPIGGGPVGETADPAPPRLRLLSSAEYRRTLEDALGVEVDVMAYADRSAGYDSGAMGRIDDTLLWSLMEAAEATSDAYVSERLEAHYPCMGASSPTPGCIEDTVEALGQRLYRRPLAQDERAELVALAEGGFRVALDRMLMSPSFLYRAELGRSEDGMLDAYERATLIAYTLTGSGPDQALLSAAAEDALGPDEIRTHVRRLLESDRGRARMAEFVRSWLRVDVLELMVSQPGSFPKLPNPQLADALVEELSAYVERVVIDERGTLSELLVSSEIPVSRHTRDIYGVESGTDIGFQSVPGRGGILTLASVMSALASENIVEHDSPVKRGLMIAEQLLCKTLGLPSGLDVSAAVDQANLDEGDFEAWTTREQFEALMEQEESCRSCHNQFMPVGFAFGGFDALGYAVDRKGERSIDTQVLDVDLAGQQVSFDGPLEVASHLATRDEVARCFIEHLVRFTVGTNEGAYERAMSVALSSGRTPSEIVVADALEALLTRPTVYQRTQGD